MCPNTKNLGTPKMFCQLNYFILIILYSLTLGEYPCSCSDRKQKQSKMRVQEMYKWKGKLSLYN